MSIGDDNIQNELIIQYKEKIEEALNDCEHVYRLTIDYQMLDQKISELIISAKQDGLTDKFFWNLDIFNTIPIAIRYIISEVPP